MTQPFLSSIQLSFFFVGCNFHGLSPLQLPLFLERVAVLVMSVGVEMVSCARGLLFRGTRAKEDVHKRVSDDKS